MPRPSTVAFHVAVEQLGIGPLWTVTPVVDGVSLVERARRVEVRPARGTGEPDLAGSYAGLVIGASPDEQEWRGWYLGHGESAFDDGDTCLLGCVCGATGCWPLSARVELGPGTVRWSRFRTGFRDWDLSALGPFVFDRERYERALDEPVVHPEQYPAPRPAGPAGTVNRRPSRPPRGWWPRAVPGARGS